MDVILKVLEGAKAGGKIAIKKEEFVIGRSQECNLCAASSAVSRRHCAIYRRDAAVSVKDLGSRNGTLVNGVKAVGEVSLKSGDEITVGPLKFLLTITAGMSNVKKPKIDSVADAVARVAEKSVGDIVDDDISRWLLLPSGGSLGVSETQTIRMDETNAVRPLTGGMTLPAGVDVGSETKAVDMTEAAAAGEQTEEAHEDDKKKTGPGKLPHIPAKPQSKDSREAAVEALRAWSRRR